MNRQNNKTWNWIFGIILLIILIKVFLNPHIVEERKDYVLQRFELNGNNKVLDPRALAYDIYCNEFVEFDLEYNKNIFPHGWYYVRNWELKNGSSEGECFEIKYKYKRVLRFGK